MTLKLGKKPARHTVKLKLKTYLNTSVLPPVPDEFGHESLVSDFGMLGNNEVGDCAIAGPLHAIMLWAAETKRTVNIDTACALKNYSAITGYDPSKTNPLTGENPSDQGSDIHQVAEYWRTQGLVDANWNRHFIGGYVALTPRDVEELWQATYIFDGVGIGVELPSEWETAFGAGEPWDAVSNPHRIGGHYILGASKRSGNEGVVTWGKVQPMTPAGYEQFNDESLAYLSQERLNQGVDIDGFDWEHLVADLQALAC